MTYKQKIERLVWELKDKLNKEYVDSKATKKDIKIVLLDNIRCDGDYRLSYQTKLYNKHGNEYTRLLEHIHILKEKGLVENLRWLR